MEKSGKSRFINFLSALGSTILSILFIITAIVLPIYYSVAGMLQPKTITTVMKNVDYVEILKDSEEINGAIESMGISAEVADEILKSKEFSGLFEDCVERIATDLLDPDADASSFDASFIKELYNERIDGILTVVEKKVDKPIEKEKIKEELGKVVENSGEAITGAVLELNPLKETMETYSTVTTTVQSTLKWYSTLGLALIEASFLGLIYLCRKRNFGGFIWIAVDTGIVGTLISFVSLALGSSFIKALFSDIPGFAGQLVGSALNVILTKLIITLAVCFVIMIGSIVACVLLRRRKPSEEIATGQ